MLLFGDDNKWTASESEWPPSPQAAQDMCAMQDCMWANCGGWVLMRLAAAEEASYRAEKVQIDLEDLQDRATKEEAWRSLYEDLLEEVGGLCDDDDLSEKMQKQCKDIVARIKKKARSIG